MMLIDKQSHLYVFLPLKYDLPSIWQKEILDNRQQDYMIIYPPYAIRLNNISSTIAKGNNPYNLHHKNAPNLNKDLM